jgi:hypothetical protein
VLHQDYDAEDFSSIASHLRLRKEDEIPAESGSCIEGGFIPIALEYERVRLGVRLKEFPDVHLSIDAHKNLDRLDEFARLELMLEQGAALAKQDGLEDVYARIKTIRRGARQLGPWSGYEMVARKPAYREDTEAHEFRYQSLGAVHDPLQPRLDLRLDSGVKKNRTSRAKPSLTDEEAVALWDKLIGTIRVRKSSDATPGSTAAARLSLGTRVASGGLCTQQGWWQCTELGNVDGEKRRHFAAGEVMPHAIVFGKPTLWDRFFGVQIRRTTATTWELMDYGDVPVVGPLVETDARTKDAPPGMN